MCFSLIKFELNYKLKDYDKFLYFYEHSQSGIVIFDSEFKVEFSNKTSLELLGENINKSIPDSLRAKMYQNFKEKSSFESDLGTVVINSQDLEFSSKTLVYNNEIYLSVSIKNNTKNQTLIGLSKTKAFRDISLASLMHKNRATLQAILDLTKQIILKEIGMSSSLIKKLKIIRLSSAILLNSCSNFIDFSFSKYTVSKSDVKIRQVLEDVVNKFKIQEKIMNVELDLKFDPLIDEIVNSETKRIKQILINLIHNSFKYINKGKIEVSASITTDNHIKIIVKDTGIGIKQDKLEEIRASLRGENINKNNMSLYVSNQHAINLGGRGLEIESSKIIGTKVSF